MNTEMNNNHEERNDLEEIRSLGFTHGQHGEYGHYGYGHHYRSPFLGSGFIAPFATGLIGGLAVNALVGGYGGYGGYGYGGYPYYGGYAYPPPYYYGGYGYPYWRYY